MTQTFLYEDRYHAGIKLADVLISKHFENPFILALPRGGVVVANVVARILEAPMDVVISRKIGALGIGAISEDEIPYFSPSYSSFYDLQSPQFHASVKYEIMQLRRRIELFRNGASLPLMDQHTVIVVDDGLATGVTAIAAGKYLRNLSPIKLVLAVPVAPEHFPRDLNQYYDEIVCPFYVENMTSIGEWYKTFSQIDDEEVLWSMRRQNLPDRDQESHLSPGSEL